MMDSLIFDLICVGTFFLLLLYMLLFSVMSIVLLSR